MFKAKLFNQFLATAWLAIILSSPLQATEKSTILDKIKLPEGFTISLFSDNVPNARSMALGKDGHSSIRWIIELLVNIIEANNTV
jgi:hypothetical protein